MQKDWFRDALFNEILHIINLADDEKSISLFDTLEIRDLIPDSSARRFSPKPPDFIITCLVSAANNPASMTFSSDIERKNWRLSEIDPVLVKNQRVLLDKSGGKTRADTGYLSMDPFYISLYDKSEKGDRDLIEQLMHLASLISICIHWYREDFFTFLTTNHPSHAKLSILTKTWMEKIAIELDLLKSARENIRVEIPLTKRVKKIFGTPSLSSPTPRIYSFSPENWVMERDHNNREAYSYMLKKPFFHMPGVMIECHQAKHSDCWKATYTEAKGTTFLGLNMEATICLAGLIIESKAYQDFFNEIPEQSRIINQNIPFEKRSCTFSRELESAFANFVDNWNRTRASQKEILSKELSYLNREQQVKKVQTIGFYPTFIPMYRLWKVHFFPNS